MITANVDMTLFRKGLAGLIRDARISAPVVVKKETGELIKTLVKLSPPDKPKTTRDAITARIRRKFLAASVATERGHNMVSEDGTIYYRSDSNFLFGVAADRDLRRASVEELKAAYYSIKTVDGATRIVYPFRKRKGRQRVAILQNILTREATVKKLIAKLRNHVGRLKAGWLVASLHGAVRLTGSNLPPKWVTRHAAGARGTFIDGTGNKEFPTFTIANSAKGISQRRVNEIVQIAVNLRGKAMAKNATFFMKGKKRIADYA